MYEQFIYPGGNLAGADLDWPGAVTSSDPGYAARQVKTWHKHPRQDTYWADMDLSDRMQRVEVPVMTTGGWYDVFRAGPVENYADLVGAGRGGSSYLVMGPWAHGQSDLQAEQPLPLGGSPESFRLGRAPGSHTLQTGSAPRGDRRRTACG